LYDKRITTIDPNGKLLQVEYAQTSAQRGSASAFFHHQTDSTDIIIIVSSRNDKDLSLIQARNPNPNGIYRLSHSLFCKMTGLMGDGRLLARHLRSHACRESRYQPSNGVQGGIEGGVTVGPIANVCGQVQHSLTITPGARPLAVDAVLCGLSGTLQEDSEPCLGMIHVGVGGTVSPVDFCACGRNADFMLKDLQEFVKGLNGPENDKKPEPTEENAQEQQEDQSIPFLVKSVASLVLDRIQLQQDGDDSTTASDRNRIKENEHENHSIRQKIDTNQGFVDIYVLYPDTKSRGGIHMKCATMVSKNKLDSVAELF
jgi:20S proteasome alpha/beta subunit